MNKSLVRGGNTKDKWVCCPQCGTKNRRISVGSEICRCSSCGTDFKAWIVKGFVTVFTVNEAEDEVSAYKRFKDYHDQLMILAD